MFNQSSIELAIPGHSVGRWPQRLFQNLVKPKPSPIPQKRRNADEDGTFLQETLLKITLSSFCIWLVLFDEVSWHLETGISQLTQLRIKANSLGTRFATSIPMHVPFRRYLRPKLLIVNHP